MKVKNLQFLTVFLETLLDTTVGEQHAPPSDAAERSYFSTAMATGHARVETCDIHRRTATPVTVKRRGSVPPAKFYFLNATVPPKEVK